MYKERHIDLQFRMIERLWGKVTLLQPQRDKEFAVEQILSDLLRSDVNNDFKAAKDGVDRTFFSNGTTSEITLNESIWSSLALSIGNTFKF